MDSIGIGIEKHDHAFPWNALQSERFRDATAQSIDQISEERIGFDFALGSFPSVERFALHRDHGLEATIAYPFDS